MEKQSKAQYSVDCSMNGVRISVDEAVQGIAAFPGLGGAVVRVYMDENAVSPSLVESCINTWSGEETKLLAALLLKVSSDDESGHSETLQSVQEEIVDQETQDLEASGTVSDENDASPDLTGGQEVEKLFVTSPTNLPQPNDARIALDGALYNKYSRDRSIHPIAKDRARDSVARQRDVIMDALQSIQNGGNIQEIASARAAQKLRALASRHAI